MDKMNDRLMPVPERLGKLMDAVMREAKPSQHGGAYYSDNNQRLHINLVSGKENDLHLPDLLPKDGSVVLHTVQYTYEELNKEMDRARDVAPSIGLSELHVDVFNNRVELGFHSDTDTGLTKKGQDVARAKLNSDAISMHLTRELAEEAPAKHGTAALHEERASSRSGEIILLPETRNGGNIIYRGGTANKTLTCGAVWGSGSNRKFGWITAGHGHRVGESIHYLGPNPNAPYYTSGHTSYLLGTVERATVNEKVDFALIERMEGCNGATDLCLDGVQANLIDGCPDYGQQVYTCASHSGPQYSTVTSPSAFSITTDGMLIEDHILVDQLTVSGDSGGILLFKPYANSNLRSFAGILRGGRERYIASGYWVQETYYVKTSNCSAIIPHFSSISFV